MIRPPINYVIGTSPDLQGDNTDVDDRITNQNIKGVKIFNLLK